MSMISQQIKEIKACAYAHEASGDAILGTASILYQAADTIESLSEKLQAANMELAAEDCGGWIPCKDRIPEENKDVLVRRQNGKVELAFRNGKNYYSTSTGDYVCTDALEWCPIP